MDKESVRKKALGKRNEISEEDLKRKSRSIIAKLETLNEFIQAFRVLAYYSHGNEVQTLEALEHWSAEKQLFLPKLNEDSSFIALPHGELKPNRYGIPEPVSGSEPEELDLIIVPGVAFDKSGGRLGMGKGYYDRFLSSHKGVLRVALAFHEQILASIPQKPYDESVDIIVTDREIIRR